jgi:hypothetical protein
MLVILSASEESQCQSREILRCAQNDKGRQACLGYLDQDDASVPTQHPNNLRPYAVEQHFVLHGMIAERKSFWRCFRLA